MKVIRFGRPYDVKIIGGQIKNDSGIVFGTLGDGVTFLPDPPPEGSEYIDLMGRGVPHARWRKKDIQRFMSMVGIDWDNDDTISQLIGKLY
jgi:hypothetical protein